MTRIELIEFCRGVERLYFTGLSFDNSMILAKMQWERREYGDMLSSFIFPSLQSAKNN